MNTDRFKKIIKYCFTSIGVILLIATLLGYTNLRNLPTTENKKTHERLQKQATSKLIFVDKDLTLPSY